jgi:hypothetical protein
MNSTMAAAVVRKIPHSRDGYGIANRKLSILTGAPRVITGCGSA